MEPESAQSDLDSEEWVREIVVSWGDDVLLDVVHVGLDQDVGSRGPSARGPRLGGRGYGEAFGFAGCRNVGPCFHLPRLALRCGSPGCEDGHGGLSAEAIQRIVRRHRAEVRFCYERALQVRPDLRGRVAVRFDIAPDGRVASSSIAATTLGDGEAETCIRDAVRRWRFPPVDRGDPVSVTYPFVFDSAGVF